MSHPVAFEHAKKFLKNLLCNLSKAEDEDPQLPRDPTPILVTSTLGVARCGLRFSSTATRTDSKTQTHCFYQFLASSRIFGLRQYEEVELDGGIDLASPFFHILLSDERPIQYFNSIEAFTLTATHGDEES